MYTWTWLYIVFIIVFSIMLGVLNDEGEAYEGDGAENDGGDGAEIMAVDALRATGPSLSPGGRTGREGNGT